MGQQLSILKFLVNNVCVFIVSREDGDPSMPVSSYNIIIWRLAECHSSDKFGYILHRRVIDFTCLIMLIKTWFHIQVNEFVPSTNSELSPQRDHLSCPRELCRGVSESSDFHFDSNHPEAWTSDSTAISKHVHDFCREWRCQRSCEDENVPTPQCRRQAIFK